MAQQRRQGRYWLCTIPERDWAIPAELPDGVAYLRGQLEQGEQTDYRHWQLLVVLTAKQSLRFMRTRFPHTGHYELSRSSAADDYVWKEETRVGEPFELGTRAINRSKSTDWERVWNDAVQGNLEGIPADIRIRCFVQIQRIGSRFAQPIGLEKAVRCYWGASGTGKSTRAWTEAGNDAYPKDPCNKWWDGYSNQTSVVVDEFCGSINLSHLLRWFDRFPVNVEVKGGVVPLRATNFWFTSNVNPRDWYPDANPEQRTALLRRMEIIEFPGFQQNEQ